MTIKDEISEWEKYHRIHIVELLEMIARAAKVKYADEDEPLARKIEQMLDLIFPLVKFKRREVQRDQESESASDDDYWD